MLWKVHEPVPIPAELQQFVGGQALVSELLVRQGIRTPVQAKAYLDFNHYQATDPFQLPGMQKAVEVVSRAIAAGEKITVWGDFDVDGQTATTVLVSGLGQLSADVNYYIPVRKRESHGISLAGLEKVIHAGNRLLLTCDTGVSEIEAIDYAKAKGLSVVITDHHKLPQKLPDADAIVNPNFLDDMHALHALPGVGVAYQFLEALRRSMHADLRTEEFLDLVALGIVADLALVINENRFLLQKGLDALRISQRAGLRKIFEKADILQKNIDEGLIGYQIAPRLNALGRLDDANMAVELFLTQDEGRAEILATQIEGLNQHRKLLTLQVSQAAVEQIERNAEQRHAPILILHGTEWPGGILGLVASHLVNRYQKPAILLTGSGEIIAGSARSVPGLDITEAISSQAQLLAGFGGHSMAGGLSLPLENLTAFRTGINNYMAEHTDKAAIEPVLQIDAELGFSQISFELVDDLARLAPFGPGNPALTFLSRNLRLESQRIVGRNQEHRLLSVQDEQGISQRVLWWNGAEEALPNGQFDLAYQLNASDFRGERQLTLTYVDANSIRPLEVGTEALEIIDHRQSVDALAELASITANQPAAVIWAEGTPPTGFVSYNRLEVPKSNELVLWNIPPSWEAAKELIEASGAKVVHVFAQASNSETLQEFLVHAAGILKYLIRQRDGEIALSEFTAKTGYPENLIQAALKWFDAKGLITILTLNKDEVKISSGSGKPQEDISHQAQDLENAWIEFEAWTRFFKEGRITAFTL